MRERTVGVAWFMADMSQATRLLRVRRSAVRLENPPAIRYLLWYSYW